MRRNDRSCYYSFGFPIKWYGRAHNITRYTRNNLNIFKQEECLSSDDVRAHAYPQLLLVFQLGISFIVFGIFDTFIVRG